MSHVIPKRISITHVGETLEQYRKKQLAQKRWLNVTRGVSDDDLNNNFEFLDAAVINRGVGKDNLLLTTTGLFGPIRSGTRVSLDNESHNLVIQSELAPADSKDDLISELNGYHDAAAGNPPNERLALEVNGFWAAAVDGGTLPSLDKSANVFGSTGQLICDSDSLNFPLLKFGPTDAEKQEYIDTLKYYGGKLLNPSDEFTLGFNQDLWGIQYDQKLPEYITEYQFGVKEGGGLFVEHHPFPHIWLPATGRDQQFNEKTLSRIILGRRLNTFKEDDYFRPVEFQKFHFTMFEIPLDGSALAIRPQCIHNDSFTQGAQTVFLGNTAANTVALRHSAPVTNMFVEGVPVSEIPE